MLKKIYAFAVTGTLFFTLPSRAFAIDVCPQNRKWSTLCSLDKGSLETLVVNAITVLFVLATLLALFFLIFGGIKWITSGGDKANLESARNMIIAAAVGLVITFLSFFIMNLVLNFLGIDYGEGFGLPALTKAL